MADEKNTEIFQLKFDAQGVSLTLGPECFADKKAALALVMDRIKQKKVDQADTEKIEQAFESNSTDTITIAPPQPEAFDGRVRARLNDAGDELSIKVEPPTGRGRRPEMNDVMDAIMEAGAEKFFLDLEKIEAMLTSFRYRDFTEVGQMRHGSFEITVSKDATDAVVKLVPAFGGDPIELNDVLAYLKRNNIVHGVKIDILKKMIADGIYNENIVIAVGQKALDGENGSIEFFFDTQTDRPKPKITEEGEVNFRELNLFQKCKAGDPLARKKTATQGIHGKTVQGTEIPARSGKDVPFPVGLNTKVSPNDPEIIIASTDGQPKLISNKINVIPLIEIPGDIDFSTGNIDFTGSVHIRGNVISGFTVKAMGDIQIGGCVEICTIECGGNLNIRSGIYGQEKALVICRGNITAKFIDKATVYAEGDILIDESIMYSKVSSSNRIVLAGKKGFIMGGITRATKSITCNQTGTANQNITILEVGGSPTLRDELEKLETEIREAEEKVDLQTRSIETVEKRRQQEGAAPTPEQQERVTLISRDRFALLSKLRAFKEKKEDLEEKLIRLRSTDLKVHVKKKVLPGTKITIKNANWIAQDPIDFVTFREYDGEVQYGPCEGG